MARSSAKSVDEYLNELPDDRRSVMQQMRALVRKHLPKGYEEAFNWSMICYQVPLERYATTYNGQPLAYVSLAAQKNYFAIYLLGVYANLQQRKALEEAFARSGKKMDMGKSCLRFRSLDDLPLEALGKLIASTPPETMIALHESSHPQKKSAPRKAAAKKKAAATKKTAAPKKTAVPKKRP
ncbi:MAG: DUF1801 domain-containing protein [Acidobacteriota bacterium]